MNSGNISEIADILSDYFARGLIIHEDALEFAYSTLGVRHPEDLESLILDPLEYGEGLIDIVFSPEDNIRYNIELLIPPGGFASSELIAIQAQVASRIGSLRIYIHYPEKYFFKPLSGELVSMFIRKMRMDKGIGCLNVRNGGPASLREISIRARLMVRSIPSTITPVRGRFIDNLVEVLTVEFPIEKKYLFQCLDFLLRMFRDMDDDLDIYGMIAEKKRIWSDIIDRKDNFRRYQRTYSMEYLMSQKIYDLPENLQDATRNILLADLIVVAAPGAATKTGLTAASNDTMNQAGAINAIVEELRLLET